MIYFDTAYLLKCYINEPASAKVREFAQKNAGIASSVIARMEFYSGIARHRREGGLSQKDATNALQFFEEDIAVGVFVLLPLTDEIMERTSAAFSRLPDTIFLRTADAIHIHTALSAKVKCLYSNDKHITETAKFFKLPCESL